MFCNQMALLSAGPLQTTLSCLWMGCTTGTVHRRVLKGKENYYIREKKKTIKYGVILYPVTEWHASGGRVTRMQV